MQGAAAPTELSRRQPPYRPIPAASATAALWLFPANPPCLQPAWNDTASAALAAQAIRHVCASIAFISKERRRHRDAGGVVTFAAIFPGGGGVRQGERPAPLAQEGSVRIRVASQLGWHQRLSSARPGLIARTASFRLRSIQHG